MRYSQASSADRPAGGRDTEPSGEVSVMPHAWMIVTPSLSNAAISDGGQAEPPTTARSSGARSCGFWSSSASRPCQIVGTAPAIVGFSAAIIAASGSGCRNRSGMISDAPTMNAA
jgi:hypothetical protein